MSNHKLHSYKYLLYFVAAFVAFYITQVVILNRLISIGNFYVTGGCAVYFLSPLIVDVVAEVYGYAIAKKLLWCGLFSLLFIGTAVYVVLLLPRVTFWTPVNNAYDLALGSLPKTAYIGSLTIFVGQFLNTFLISKWRILLKGKYFWLRSVGSSILGDVTTLVLANIGIFSGRMTGSKIADLVLPQIIVLILCSSVGAIPAGFLAKIIARAEGLNVIHENNINFNPFNLNK